MYKFQKKLELNKFQGVKFNMVNGVAYFSNGDIAVLDALNSRVCIFDKEGKEIHNFGKKGFRDNEFHNPVSIAINSNNEIYVADWMNHAIKIFTKKGKFIFSYGKYGKPKEKFKIFNRLKKIRSCMISNKNSKFRFINKNINFLKYLLYQIKKHKGIISFFRYIQSNKDIFYKPDGFAFKDNEVFISQHFQNTICIFDPKEKKIRKKIGNPYTDTKFNKPSNLCFDRKKNLYVSDSFNYCVRVFDQNLIENESIIGKYSLKKYFFPFGIKEIEQDILVICGMELIQFYNVKNSEVIYSFQDGFNQLHGLDYISIGNKKFNLLLADRLNHRAIIYQIEK